MSLGDLRMFLTLFLSYLLGIHSGSYLRKVSEICLLIKSVLRIFQKRNPKKENEIDQGGFKNLYWKKTHIFWNFTAISVLNRFKPDNRPAIDTVFTLKCFFNVTTNNKKETINLYWCTCCTEHRKKDKIICIIYTIKDYNPVIIIGFTNLIFFF